MNDAVTFFVGCFTFVIVMILKIPVKKITWHLAQRNTLDRDACYIRYKRYNAVLFLLVAAVAVGAYYVLYRLVNLDHFKLCCTLKAGALAIALYAVYDQCVEDSDPKEKI